MSRRQLQRTERVTDLGTDDSGCHVLHVDMDAFFASVEVRDRPELRGLPVIVGRKEGRGVVLSATYEARRAGVHSAMPMALARHRCPQAVIVEPTRGKYLEASTAVMSVLADVTPKCEVVSVDEAYLDVSGSVRAMGSSGQIAVGIRQRVSAELGLTCSIGVAPVTLVAKAASTQVKPDGMLIVPAARMLEFLHSLPIGQLWGVGPGTEPKLKDLGIDTVGDLASTPVRRLQRALGNSAGMRLAQLASGQELRAVHPGVAEKSVSAEHTFDSDVRDDATLEHQLRSLSEGVARRLRAHGHLARTIGLKIRYEDFSTITRSVTVSEPLDSSMAVYRAVHRLWKALAVPPDRLVRLVGVRAGQLVESDRVGSQLTLDVTDDAPAEQLQNAEAALDEITAKFGSQALRPARMVDPKF